MIPKIAPMPPVGSTPPKGMSPTNPIDDKSGRFNRLQPAFKKQLMSLANDFYKMHQRPLILTDTLRTHTEQAQAHLEKPSLALPAGHPNAMHPKGLAVDVDQTQANLITPEMLAKNGLHLPALSKGETWHIEPKFRSFAVSNPSSSKPYNLSDTELSNRSLHRAAKLSLSEPLSLLNQQGLTEGGATDDRRRLKAAMEIEAIFLEQLMGQMRRTMVEPLSPGSQKLKGYLNLADQQLARALAAGGGLGLASKILENLTPLESQPHKENRHEGNPFPPGRTDPPARDLPVSRTS